MIQVKVNIEPLRRFAEVVDRDLRRRGNGPIREALVQWAARYRGFIRERFDRFSKGGGDWDDLAPSTILARRAGRTKGKGVKTRRQEIKRLMGLAQRQFDQAYRAERVKGDRDKATTLRAKASKNWGKALSLGTMAGISILRDTGTLFAALDTKFSGKPGQLEEAIPFGIRVGFGGPGRPPKGKATIADIAGFHQTGTGRMPARPILVEPSPEVVAAMAGDMERAVARLARESGAD